MRAGFILKKQVGNVLWPMASLLELSKWLRACVKRGNAHTERLTLVVRRCLPWVVAVGRVELGWCEREEVPREGR